MFLNGAFWLNAIFAVTKVFLSPKMKSRISNCKDNTQKVVKEVGGVEYIPKDFGHVAFGTGPSMIDFIQACSKPESV